MGSATLPLDLDGRSVDTVSRAQIERFAMVRIPDSATNLRSYVRGGIDTQLLASFACPARTSTRSCAPVASAPS